jgi:hypothetical protein
MNEIESLSKCLEALEYFSLKCTVFIHFSDCWFHYRFIGALHKLRNFVIGHELQCFSHLTKILTFDFACGVVSFPCR